MMHPKLSGARIVVATLFLCLVIVLPTLFIDSKPQISLLPGRALTVVSIEKGNFTVNIPNLLSITDQIDPETPVGVIAIAGEFRKGKSFVLNFFLQYLNHLHQTASRPDPIHDMEEFESLIQADGHSWLQDIDPTNRFSFRSGKHRHTAGIDMWSQPFVISNKYGRKLAVLVVDSQGLWDTKTDTNDNVRIFSMVSLLSSSLIMNTKGQIALKDLKDLKYFAEYAATESKVDTHMKTFQRLTFLIRDFELEKSFGWEEGQEMLDRFMKESTVAEVIHISQNISKGYEKIDAFALPHPGDKVTSKEFTGKLIDIKPEFLFHLEKFVTNVSDNVRPTRHLSEVKAGELRNYTQSLATAFNNKLSPEDMRTLLDVRDQFEALEKVNEIITDCSTRLRQFMDNKTEEYYLEKSLDEIVKDLTDQTVLLTDESMAKFSSSPYASINVPKGKDALHNATEHLRDGLVKRFATDIEHLTEIATEKKNNAVRAEQERREKDEKKKRKIREAIECSERRVHALYVWQEEVNEVERKRQVQEDWNWLNVIPVVGWVIYGSTVGYSHIPMPEKPNIICPNVEDIHK